jgi:hypothetical protein
MAGASRTAASEFDHPAYGKRSFTFLKRKTTMKKSMMPTAKSVLIAGVLATVMWVSAGSLTPPAGPVSPTMKNLLDVEPRTAIRNDFISITPIVISQPGSYYLAEDIQAIHSQFGIEITASNVTLDLNGFTVYGNTEVGSLDGIQVTGLRTNITIRNGVVRDFFGKGIDMVTASKSLVEQVRATNNGGHGIHIGENSVVDRCISTNNGAGGVFADFNVIVSRTVASDNAQHGITTNPGSVVSNCVADSNGSSGIFTSGSLVENCSATGNGQSGIGASQGKVVDCIANNNTVDGIAAGSSHIFNNECHSNDSTGIHISGSDSRVDSNNVTNSPRGIDVDNANNVIIRNSANSNSVTNYDIVGGNDVGPIGTAAASTSPWANISF